MEWTEEIVAKLRELWTQGLSTAEIGRHLNVTKNAVVGKAHRLGLEGRPSPIRRAVVKKEKVVSAKVEVKEETKPVEKVVRTEKAVAKPKADKLDKVEKVKVAPIAGSSKTIEVKQLDMMAAAVKKEAKPVKKAKIEFSTPVELPKRRSLSDCCWPIGDPGTKDFHFCGAKAIPGKPYCLEHVQIAYVKLRDRKGNAA
ncbi:hypothetical protein CIN_00190 [Commensalibacter intestini A911]|uniref:GcrA cell cycle regulator n=1 Tax=Commensalibacter intestini A911 TaxID=1088868 RepID=G6EXC3_9PROT|nr:GcrA family cell cycle regulator [Commensalibacter intestini]EHD15037.1 hypothetical protein CIN_00190 [Commensalibacter intestini A911]